MTDEFDPVVVRLERAAEQWNEPATERAEIRFESSALSHVLKHSVVSDIFGYGMILLLAAFLLLWPAALLGHARAWSQRVCMVSDDPSVVAVRRYGDRVVAASLSGDGSREIRGFVLLPVDDPDVMWTKQVLGRLREIRVCQRDQMTDQSC